ncbi:hypothetical protein GCM10008916_12830 [Clostridium nitritogenes]|uniref:SHOCT domain-containing protein n=1 Tax=Clostridium nitritogenes TaxID=83340 RepID=A0ABN1LLX6_9CLOT
MGILKKKKEDSKSNKPNLFFKKTNKKKDIKLCDICGKNEAKLIVAKRVVCKECFKLAYDCKPLFKNHKDINLATIKADIKVNKEIRNNMDKFNTTSCINGVRFDDNNNQIMLPPKLGHTLAKVYNYNDILDFELIEDGNVLVTKGGLGRAIAGGLLFGGVGAIVGGVTGKRKSNETIQRLLVRLTIANCFSPIHEDIIFISTKINKNSKTYSKELQNAKDLLLKLDSSKSLSNSETNILYSNKVNNNLSVADELIKLKALMDDGIITKIEFENQKNKLLDK